MPAPNVRGALPAPLGALPFEASVEGAKKPRTVGSIEAQ